MSKWIGYAVSVNCAEPLGCYQGTILEADGNTITLTKAFRNGFPYPKAQVTLNSADIRELKIIEERSLPSEQTHSTVAVTKTKKGARATVCENLQANNNSSGNQSTSNVSASGNKVNNRNSAAQPVKSKPIDIQQGRNNNKNNNHAGSYGASGSTPKNRNTRRRHEAFLGDPTDPALDHDFDFEGNLALFDKQALWEQMRHQKPDILRGADEPRLRHDEHVVACAARPAVRAPAALVAAQYVTDAGRAVPALHAHVRRALYHALGDLAGDARLLLARGACDAALRLVGGRLGEARHRAPRAVALAAGHAAGAAALRAARVLASHAVHAHVYVTPHAPLHVDVTRELKALALSGIRPSTRLEDVPSPDLILLALHEPGLDDDQRQYIDVLEWAKNSRAPVVALEPPENGFAGLEPRASVVALLPPAGGAALGRLFLTNVAPPLSIFKDLGIDYHPPFGASALLALHPAD